MRCKPIGGGLTKREAPYYSVDELLGNPELLTAWHVEKRYAELAKRCRGILRDVGLPDRSGCYVVADAETDTPLAWFELNEESKPRLMSLQAARTGYSIFHGYFDGDAEPESPAWLAAQILGRIEQLNSPHLGLRVDGLSPSNRKELLQYIPHRRDALLSTIGEMKERLFWKLHHEKAALRAYASDDNRKEGAKVGAQANRNAKDHRKTLLGTWLLQNISEDELATTANRQLARRFAKDGLPALREEWDGCGDNGRPGLRRWYANDSLSLLERYISQLRKQGRLPAQLKKT